MKKYSIVSLGCSKNLVDSEVFSAIASNAGFKFTEILESAEFIIVNTCGFILDAKQESIDTILEMAEYKASGKCEKLIVTGCLVKRYFDDLADSISEIDELIDLKDFDKFAEIFQTAKIDERILLTPSHYAYLRISDGCDNHCSYCAIPAIRGNLQSVPLEKLIAEAKELVERGVRELILTAQDSALYGFDLYGESRLAELLKEIHKIEKLQWIRVLYLHPAHITSRLIDTFSELPKVCNYFEIPIQHINNEILRSMNRKITRKRIEEIISEIRTKIPEAVIRTTLIVGYPGETEEKFAELKDFIEKTNFERMGVFTYSEEEGTAAADLPNNIEEETAEARKDELMSLQQKISEKFLSSLIGRKIKVIIDRKGNDGEFPLEGRSYFDAPEIDGTVFVENGKAEIGEIVEVEIVDAWEYDVIGRIV